MNQYPIPSAIHLCPLSFCVWLSQEQERVIHMEWFTQNLWHHWSWVTDRWSVRCGWDKLLTGICGEGSRSWTCTRWSPISLQLLAMLRMQFILIINCYEANYPELSSQPIPATILSFLMSLSSEFEQCNFPCNVCKQWNVHNGFTTPPSTLSWSALISWKLESTGP